MSLKQKQRNDILRILAEVGIEHEVEWSLAEGKEKPQPVKFPKGTTVLGVSGTHWYFAISPEREAWWAPSAQVSSWHLKGRDFQQVLDEAIRPWAKELKRELDEPQLWWPESGAQDCQHILLPHQQNQVYLALQKSSAHFNSAVWQGSGAHTLLSIGNYSLTLNWSYESTQQRHLWKGRRAPGPEHPQEDYEVQGWDEGMVPIISRWARDLAEEQREQSLIPLPASLPGGVVAPARLLELRLNGIRAFKDFRFSFRDPEGKPRLTTLLIGENGSGKTTLLRALALALCPRADAEVLLSSPLGPILGSNSLGMIEIDFVELGDRVHTRTLELKRHGSREEVANETGPLPTLFAYASGAGRCVEGASVPTAKEFRRYQSLQSLFDYSIQQSNPELVLRRLRDQNPSGFPQILSAWCETLGLGERAIELSDEQGVEVRMGKQAPVPLRSLADGYRLTFSWLLDLFAWATASGQPIVKDLQGLLLIDELERHLHPKLQAEFLLRLRKTYPHVQIVATTHSPLAALGALTGELFVAHQQGGRVVIDSVPSTEGLSVEDLVTSKEAFDTVAYPPATADLLGEYDRLSLLPPERRSEEQRCRLAELTETLNQVFAGGEA